MARKAGLSRGDVVAAAVSIADAGRDGGLGVVTLAAVAAQLGVRSPSLYAHVDGVAELHRAVGLHAAVAMAGTLRRAAVGRPPFEALRHMATAYRRFASVHPGLYDALQRAVDPNDDEEMYLALLGVVAPVFSALAGAGVDSESERVHLTRALRSAWHGFVTLERHGGFGLPHAVDESFRRMTDVVLVGVRQAAAASRLPASPRMATRG
jgi:AcrR family transcriptional regulator